MKFKHQYVIKWHDTDANREVRPSALVTYLQETANEHLIHIGISLDELRDRYGLAFILGSISVRVYEPLLSGDEIEVSTWTCGEKGFRHNRCFRVVKGEKTVAEATSVWALINLRDGSLVKVHIHSFNPEDVIKYVRQYGEMITVKIENMSVQHSEIASQKPERQKFAVVATATGEGLIGFFEGVGVSAVIDGGRTNNPSTEDFIEAFKKVNAEYIVVLPNDSNVVLTAEQAATLYTDADVRVVKTKSLAEGYSALSMMDLSVDTIEHLISDMTAGLPNVSTGYVTTATRDAFISGVNIKKDDWMGLEGDTVYASTDSPVKAAKELFQKLPDIDDKQVVTAFYGKEVSEDELAELEAFFQEEFPLLEVGFIEGGQDVYRYIFAIE